MDSLTAMPAPTAALVGAGIALAVLCTYQIRQIPAWTERGIHPVLGWKVIVPAQVITGLLSAFFLAPVWGIAAAVAAAGFAWLSTLAVATDLATRKIPWDVAYPPAAIGAACFALDYTIEGALSFGAAALGVVGMPMLLRTLTNKGLGMSDVRFLIAATATTSWWVGQTWLLYALMAAGVSQTVVRVLAPRHGWGSEVPVPGKDGATRLELPFAPALVLSTWAFLIYATHTGYGACQMWNPFGCS